MSYSVTRKAATLATTVALAFVLAGCGGDSDKEATGKGGNPFGNLGKTEEAKASETPEPTVTEEGLGEDEGNESNGDPSDCDVIDDATIASITGLPFEGVEPLVESIEGAQLSCTWNLEASDAAAVFQVVIADGQGEDMALTRESLSAVFDDVADVSIPGADFAFTVMGGVLVGMAIDGDYIQVMYMDMYGGETTSATVELATEVASNL